jgi:hypothetical protein
MSAFRDALHIGIDTNGQRMDLAVDLLRQNAGVVVLADQLVLRPESERVVCEVIASDISRKRSATEYEEMVAGGKELLSRSMLRDGLSARELEWLVVADLGNSSVELWHAT